MSDPFARLLAGGDRRSIGRVDEVVAAVRADPGRFGELAGLMVHADPVVRMRAADAVEKVTRARPELLQPYARFLLEEVAAVEQQEVRWHLAQLIPRLDLDEAGREHAVGLLLGWLDDRSAIVQAFALQALADLAGDDPSLQRRVIALAERLADHGRPAVRARARTVLARRRPSG